MLLLLAGSFGSLAGNLIHSLYNLELLKAAIYGLFYLYCSLMMKLDASSSVNCYYLSTIWNCLSLSKISEMLLICSMIWIVIWCQRNRLYLNILKNVTACLFIVWDLRWSLIMRLIIAINRVNNILRWKHVILLVTLTSLSRKPIRCLALWWKYALNFMIL